MMKSLTDTLICSEMTKGETVWGDMCIYLLFLTMIQTLGFEQAGKRVREVQTKQVLGWWMGMKSSITRDGTRVSTYVTWFHCMGSGSLHFVSQLFWTLGGKLQLGTISLSATSLFSFPLLVYDSSGPAVWAWHRCQLLLVSISAAPDSYECCERDD